MADAFSDVHGVERVFYFKSAPVYPERENKTGVTWDSISWVKYSNRIPSPS